MKSRIMYLERKEESLSGGAAHIGRVSFSKSGKTLRYGNKTFRSLKGRGFKANFFHVESGEQYWISSCKRDGSDRLYGERVAISIDADARDEYWTAIRNLPDKRNEPLA